jgi:hypothetical protein
MHRSVRTLATCLALATAFASVASPPANAPVAPAEPGDPFPGRRDVRVDELFAAVAAQVATVARSPGVRRDYARFLGERKLADDPALYLDYVRIRIAFEATRAGGLWGVAWRITDQQPQSDRVWAQWQALTIADTAALPTVSAVAECDELSALFAVVARRIGLSARSEVGLFWPAANHTVAVWTLDRGGKHETRIVVPTSQIFLGPADSLGTTAFDPWTQRQIHDYRRVDAAPGLALPAAVARRFVWAVREYGSRPQAQLQAMRNARERQQWALAAAAQ